jgi:hypothetical protein
MRTITITLFDQELRSLEELAERFNIRLEDLAHLGIEELLSQRDDAFRNVMEYVLTKNEELYKRLA